MNMKSNNQYLKGIAKNTGSNVSANRSDNYYLKRIEENTKGGISGGGTDDIEYIEVTITYDDDSTETVKLLQYTGGD